MTDAAAHSIAEKSFDIQRSRMQRRESYFNKFSEALGPVLAARFIQVDGQVSTLLDFELMKATPLGFRCRLKIARISFCTSCDAQE